MRPDHYLRLSIIASRMKNDKVIQGYKTLMNHTGHDVLRKKLWEGLMSHVRKFYPDFISIINIYK